VEWFKYQFEKMMLRRTLAADVNALLARTTIVSKRRARYSINRVLLPTAPWFAPVSGAFVSSRAFRRADGPDDQFIGIKKHVNTLAEQIKKEDDDRSLKVFSIVGFGGLGKTTLAVELWWHLDTDFQSQALVSVSQTGIRWWEGHEGTDGPSAPADGEDKRR
jgi:disease resistance protein RPM1